MEKKGEILKIALALDEDIHNLQAQIDDKRRLLEALGNICDHPDIETYRGRQVGTCEFCLREFMSHEEVDGIFSE